MLNLTQIPTGQLLAYAQNIQDEILHLAQIFAPPGMVATRRAALRAVYDELRRRDSERCPSCGD